MPNVTIYGKTSTGDYRPVAVDAGGTVQTSASFGGTSTVKEVRASTATVSAVAGTTVSGTILASNANRLGAALYNDSTAALYLVIGTAPASSTSFSIAVAGSAYFELPYHYTGVLMGAWAANAGSVRVTEFA
jgi:hypothetical protein